MATLRAYTVVCPQKRFASLVAIILFVNCSYNLGSYQEVDIFFHMWRVTGGDYGHYCTHNQRRFMCLLGRADLVGLEPGKIIPLPVNRRLRRNDVPPVAAELYVFGVHRFHLLERPLTK